MSTQAQEKVKYCSNCGGAMEFHIGKQKIVCKNCNTALELEPSGRVIRQRDFSEARSMNVQGEWDNSVSVLTCRHCGAEVSVAANVTSVACRYCGSSQMLQSRRETGVAPEALMLFKVQKHDASAIYSKWLRKRFFAPGALKTLAQQDKLTAVYSPFWTYDAQAHGMYTGEGGTRRRETVTVNGKTETRTHVDWRHVSGSVSKAFVDVLVYAGTTGAKLLGKMNTFDTQRGLIPFESSYLAGFQAETYSVPPEQGFETAKQKMQAELEGMAARDIRRRYDEARSVRVNATYSGVTFKHVLLPVWFCGFTYRGKNFSVTINGSTGEIRGAYPKSAAKIAVAAGIAAAVIAGVILLVALLGKG